MTYAYKNNIFQRKKYERKRTVLDFSQIHLKFGLIKSSRILISDSALYLTCCHTACGGKKNKKKKMYCDSSWPFPSFFSCRILSLAFECTWATLLVLKSIWGYETTWACWDPIRALHALPFGSLLVYLRQTLREQAVMVSHWKPEGKPRGHTKGRSS